MDVLVKWDKDGKENVVARTDLKVIGGGRLRGNSRVKMWWTDNRWWKGTVLRIMNKTNESNADDSDDEDNITLASLLQSNNGSSGAEFDCLNPDDSAVAAAADALNSSGVFAAILEYENENAQSNDESDLRLLNVPSANERIRVIRKNIDDMRKNATSIDQSDYSSESDGNDDIDKDPDFTPAINNDMAHQVNKQTATTNRLSENETPITDLQPETYQVEGEPQVPLNDQGPPSKKSRRHLVKEGRVYGKAYLTEKTMNVVEARNTLKDRCNSRVCELRGLSCGEITEIQRQKINDDYYHMETLSDQRNWLSRHIKAKALDNDPASRKSRSVEYYLPRDSNANVCVCRVMFLNTLNIAERQVRTVLDKTTTTGVLEKENRGGRPLVQKERDARIRDLVKTHIDRFPRAESHYCRADTNMQYLSSELNLSMMHQMYQKSQDAENSVSFAYYSRCFKTMNLRFLKPKKDLYGICESFRRGSEEEKEKQRETYEKHIQEKTKVRDIKEKLKNRHNDQMLVASFDLQQVIYLPRSNRCEVFYKRRLSCYNFSIFDIKLREATCFVWNESIAARGANEISSHLSRYLQEADKKGYESAALFCDGCGGQNKNSIVPSMLMHSIRNTRNLKDVTIFYFETNHGQSEGDSVHSVVERSLKRTQELFVPSQLSTLIRLASSNPYNVIDVATHEIMDYKTLSQSQGILRVRVTDTGSAIKWADFKQIKVDKESPDIIFVKTSHNDDPFEKIVLPTKRYDVSNLQKAYRVAPSISNEKYQDLLSLCCGNTPVITSAEHVSFFKGLRN